MSFFSPSELQVIQALRDGSGEHPFADAYDYVVSLISVDGEPKAGVDAGVWQWLNGAAQVNRDVGPFSEFIRAYTAAQYRSRTGDEISPNGVQEASDAIATQVIQHILDSGNLPTLEEIGIDDAGETARELFSGNTAGWSGNLLFPALGDDSFFRETLIEDPEGGDTYDLLAALKSSSEAGYAISASNLLDVILQIKSLVYGSGSTLNLGLLGQLASDTYSFFSTAYGLSLYRMEDNIILDAISSGAVVNGSGAGDVINAFDGNDIIFSSSGSDLIDGGEGVDRVSYIPSGAVSVSIATSDSAAICVGSVDKSGLFEDYLFNVEVISGSNDDDHFDIQSVDARLTALTLDGLGGDLDVLTVSVAPVTGAFRYIRDMAAVGFGGAMEISFENFEAVELTGFYSDSAVLTSASFSRFTQTGYLDLGYSSSLLNEQGERVLDTIDASALSSGITVSLVDPTDQTVSQGGAGTLHFRNAEGVVGTAFNDTLTGGLVGNSDAAGNILKGGGGDDSITDGPGDDRLFGEAGNDIIFSTEGNDVISGGTGNDVIHLKSKATVQFEPNGGHDVVFLDDDNNEVVIDLSQWSINDLDIIVGGTDDSYMAEGDLDEINIQFLAFKIRETGETITIARENDDIGYQSSYDRSREGVEYASSHIPISSLTLSNGVTLSNSDLWSYIENHFDNDNVKPDLMTYTPYGKGDDGLFPGQRSLAGAYLYHINNSYFSPNPIKVASLTFSGTEGDDYITDDNGDDVVTGGSGDDTLVLTAGNDTVIWNLGDGDDYISGIGEFCGNDVLRLGVGLSSENLVFNADTYGNINLTFNNGAGSVSLGSQLFSREGDGQISIELSDGSLVSYGTIKTFATESLPANHVIINGTSGNDSEFLPLLNFTYSGLGGDDTIYTSEGGSGEIKFSKFDGNDKFFGSVNRQDILVLTDSLPSDVTFTEVPSDFYTNEGTVVISISGGGSFTLDAQLSLTPDGGSQGISEIHFSDGTIWSRALIEQAVIQLGETSSLRSRTNDLLLSMDDAIWRKSGVQALGVSGFSQPAFAATVESELWEGMGWGCLNKPITNRRYKSTTIVEDSNVPHCAAIPGLIGNAAAQLVEMSAAFKPLTAGMNNDEYNEIAHMSKPQVLGIGLEKSCGHGGTLA